MKKLKKILSAVLTAAMLMTSSASLAEVECYAGDLTGTAVQESFAAGKCLTGTITFAPALSVSSSKLDAAMDLLSKLSVEYSVQNKNGVTRLTLNAVLDGVKAADADCRILADGSVQMMTSLTGDIMLTLPAGSVAVNSSFNASELLFGAYEAEDTGEVKGDEFASMSASQRLRETSADVIVLLLNHLLGWTSFTQTLTGELYTFDDTYLDATETRDAVAQRMLGKIEACDLNRFFWNVCTALQDNCNDFQQALADVFAEHGITSWQVYQLADALFPNDAIDPAMDMVKAESKISDNGELCTKNDIRYFAVKMTKRAYQNWCDSTHNILTMDVSYDDYGDMVGFDVDMPQFTQNIDYDGDFTWSKKTDDDWQVYQTAAGTLAVNGVNISGSYSSKDGEDIDSVNESWKKGEMTVQAGGVETSVSLDASKVWTLNDSYDGESLEDHVTMNLAVGGVSVPVTVSVTGGTSIADGLSVQMTGSVGAEGIGSVSADVTLAEQEAEMPELSAASTVDLGDLLDAESEGYAAVKANVQENAASVALGFATHLKVMSDVLALKAE